LRQNQHPLKAFGIGISLSFHLKCHVKIGVTLLQLFFPYYYLFSLATCLMHNFCLFLSPLEVRLLLLSPWLNLARICLRPKFIRHILFSPRLLFAEFCSPSFGFAEFEFAHNGWKRFHFLIHHIVSPYTLDYLLDVLSE